MWLGRSFFSGAPSGVDSAEQVEAVVVVAADGDHDCDEEIAPVLLPMGEKSQTGVEYLVACLLPSFDG